MKCPICGTAELVHDSRNLPYTCDDEATIIPAVVGDYCPACGEGVFDAAQSARVSAAIRALRRFSHDEARSVEKITCALDADGIKQPSHAWHGDALRDTERRYEAGHEQPVDWAVAKQELQERRKVCS